MMRPQTLDETKDILAWFEPNKWRCSFNATDMARSCQTEIPRANETTLVDCAKCAYFEAVLAANSCQIYSHEDDKRSDGCHCRPCHPVADKSGTPPQPTGAEHQRYITKKRSTLP